MIKISQAIIVEGKYDKIKLSSIFDATIIETNGFRIFKNAEQLQMLRILAEKTGLIIVTDSDTAGFKIRRFIGSAIDKSKIINVYIPDIYGKEKRKIKPSAEGKLGVEGVNKDIILKAFENAGVIYAEKNEKRREITKIDLFEDGLTGGQDSSIKREALLRQLNLPERLTTNSMLPILNTMLNYDEYKSIINKINEK